MPPYFAVPPISRFLRPDFFHPKIREIGGYDCSINHAESNKKGFRIIGQYRASLSASQISIKYCTCVAHARRAYNANVRIVLKTFLFDSSWLILLVTKIWGRLLKNSVLQSVKFDQIACGVPKLWTNYRPPTSYGYFPELVEALRPWKIFLSWFRSNPVILVYFFAKKNIMKKTEIRSSCIAAKNSKNLIFT